LTGTLDAHERFQQVADTSVSVVVDALVKMNEDGSATTMYSIVTINSWKINLVQVLEEIYMLQRTDFFCKPNTASYLGDASKRLYAYVRHELGVPFYQWLVENPLPTDVDDGTINGREKKTIGGCISIIYEALQSGDMHRQIMGCLEGKEMIDMNGGVTSLVEGWVRFNGPCS
jgi:phenylalanine ammonia-lyase